MGTTEEKVKQAGLRLPNRIPFLLAPEACDALRLNLFAARRNALKSSNACITRSKSYDMSVE
jgi:hypothetical protein